MDDVASRTPHPTPRPDDDARVPGLDVDDGSLRRRWNGPLLPLAQCDDERDATGPRRQHARATEEAARDEHYDGAAEYRRYAEKLSQNPDLTLMYEGSIRFEETSQLVQLGLMQDTEAWAAVRTHRIT